MSRYTATVSVNCPVCDEPIEFTLYATSHPGTRLEPPDFEVDDNASYWDVHPVCKVSVKDQLRLYYRAVKLAGSGDLWQPVEYDYEHDHD